jgi:hypothetical protein
LGTERESEKASERERGSERKVESGSERESYIPAATHSPSHSIPHACTHPLSLDLRLSQVALQLLIWAKKEQYKNPIRQDLSLSSEGGSPVRETPESPE